MKATLKVNENQKDFIRNNNIVVKFRSVLEAANVLNVLEKILPNVYIDTIEYKYNRGRGYIIYLTKAKIINTIFNDNKEDFQSLEDDNEVYIQVRYKDLMSIE